MSDTTWATPAAVLALTGVSVDQSMVDLAASVISQKTGAIDDATIMPAGFIGPRDLYWLGQAVMFQAAWMPSQPDLLGRLDATEVMADGQRVYLKADANVLAPLARGAMKRLSWRGSRTAMDRRVAGWLRAQDLLARERYLAALRGLNGGAGGMGMLDPSQPQGNDASLPWSPL